MPPNSSFRHDVYERADHRHVQRVVEGRLKASSKPVTTARTGRLPSGLAQQAPWCSNSARAAVVQPVTSSARQRISRTGDQRGHEEALSRTFSMTFCVVMPSNTCGGVERTSSRFVVCSHPGPHLPSRRFCMKSRASFACLGERLFGRTDERRVRSQRTRIRHEVVELLRPGPCTLTRWRWANCARTRSPVRRPQQMRMRWWRAVHGVFAEHRHAVVLADDRIVNIDLEFAHHGASSTTLCGSFASMANS